MNRNSVNTETDTGTTADLLRPTPFSRNNDRLTSKNLDLELVFFLSSKRLYSQRSCHRGFFYIFVMN